MSLTQAIAPERNVAPNTAAVRVEAAGSTPDEAMADLPALYAGQHWATRPTTNPYSYRYLAVGDSNLTLGRSQMSGYLRGDLPPGDHYVVLQLTAGTTTLHSVLDEQRVVSCTPTLLDPDHTIELEAQDYDQRLVHLNKTFVTAVAAEQYDTGSGPLALEYGTSPSAVQVNRWNRVLETASASLADGVSCLLWQETSRAAAAALLDLFPPRASVLPEALTYPRNARLRLSVEYLHEHVAEPLVIADIARASGLSIRSIQESFNRVFDTTPMAYLRQLRLEHVRDELRTHTPDTTTVGEVARRWGFAHLGRFSADYQRRFNEYPRTTLQD